MVRELADSFMVSPAVVSPPLVVSPPPVSPPAPTVFPLPVEEPGSKVCMSQEQLIMEHKQDKSLIALVDGAVSVDEIEKKSTGYFLKDEVLMCKWTPPHVSMHDDWRVVTYLGKIVGRGQASPF